MSKGNNFEMVIFQNNLKKTKYQGKKFICFILTLLFLGSFGCGRDTVYEECTTTPELRTNNQSLEENSAGSEEIESSKDPSTSPIAPSSITLESSIETIENQHFLFFPDSEQLARFETEALHLEERLKQITNGADNAFGMAVYDKTNVIQLLSGNFNTMSNWTEEDKTAAVFYMNNFLNTYILTIRDIGDISSTEENEKISIRNPQFYKIFDVAGLELYSGAEELKLFEEAAQEAFEAALNHNDSLFIKKAQVVTGTIENLLIAKNTIYLKGDFYQMHPLVKLVLLKEMHAAIYFIASFTGDFNLKSSEGAKYNLSTYKEIIHSDAMKKQIEAEIISLMVAYEEAMKVAD